MGKLTRNRVIKTCQYCYDHKLKCDRNKPCSTCERTKNNCVYYSKDKKNNAKVKNFVQSKKNDLVVLSGYKDTPVYHSRAFFPYLEPSINKLLLFSLSRENETLNGADQIGSFNFQSQGLLFSLNEIINCFPSKEIADEGLRIFWDAIHPLIPIFDKSETEKQYEKFWLDLQKPQKTFNVHFAVILVSILFSVTICQEVNELDEEILKKITDQKIHFMTIFEKIKIFFKFDTNPNLSFIQASIILFQSGCMYYLNIFSYTAMLSRLAEYLGLHRDPVLQSTNGDFKNISSKDVQTRRFSWHWVRFLDTSSSIVSGLSPRMAMINSSSIVPSKYDFNPATGNFDGEINPFTIFAIIRFKSCFVFENIAFFLNSDYVDNQTSKKSDELAECVLKLYDEVAELSQQIFNCNENIYSSPVKRWLVSNGAILLHRIYLYFRASSRPHNSRIVYKPLNASKIEISKLKQKSTNKDFFASILTVKSKYEDDLVEVAVLLLYETKFRVGDSDDFKKFKWFSKNANPLQYVFFVIKDIYIHPLKIYRFDKVPPPIKKFIFDDELLSPTSDIRRLVVDSCLKSLVTLKRFWSEPICDLISFLSELRTYVWKTRPNVTDMDNTTKNQQSKDFDDFVDASSEPFKYSSFSQFFFDMNSDTDSFSELSNGFWDFGIP